MHDPYGKFWIRLGGVLDGEMFLNAYLPPCSTISVGPADSDTIRVPATIMPKSQILVRNGTLVEDVEGITVQFKEGSELKRIRSPDALPLRIRTPSVKIEIPGGLTVLLQYVSSEKEAQERQSATARNIVIVGPGARHDGDGD